MGLSGQNDTVTCKVSDIIMRAMASLITSVSIVYSTLLFRRRSKIVSKLRATGLREGTGEFPAQMTSNAAIFPFDDVIMCSVCVEEHECGNRQTTRGISVLFFFSGNILQHSLVFKRRFIVCTCRRQIHPLCLHAVCSRWAVGRSPNSPVTQN